MFGIASQDSSFIELALKLNSLGGRALFELVGAETNFSCCWDESQNLLKVYLKDTAQKEDFQRFLARISSHLPFSVKGLKERRIDEKDYLFKWRNYFKPVEIGESLIIRPPWSARRREKVEVIIEPGLAFGTGSHATTQGCMVALERLVQEGDTLLDVGTGSGVIAIASVKLGASQALGIDIDSLTLANACRNAQLNLVDGKVCFIEMSLESLKCGSFDLVVANLDFPTLTAGLTSFKNLSFRFLIIGGFLVNESPALEAAYSELFRLEDSLELDGWRTLVWSN